ncbi:MAG TPA: sigma-70 family RNA polymerase sigma factor [Planctomycetota bacterium]|nr:sigma-70 family RNA polymerase sigma factor [Planctomycetota bacterium]
MTAPETPEQLFLRFRDGGDPADLAAVFDCLAPRLLLLAAHVTPDPAAAEDLLQDTFLQAMERAQQWDADRPLLPWLGGILRHRAVDLARRLRLRRSTAQLGPGGVASSPTGPIDDAATKELLDRVQLALESLRPPYREALVLRIVHGMEPTAIAHALGRPPATVRVQLKRGIAALRSALPASLANALALLLSGRGLAATRTALLAAAGGAAIGTAAGAAPRVARRAGWLAAAAVALGLGVGAYHWSTPRAPSSAGPTVGTHGANETAVEPSPPVGDQPARVAAPSDPPRATPTRLRGRLVRASDRTPLSGGHVEVTFSPGRFVTDDPTFRRWPDPVEADAGADGTFTVAIDPEPEMRIGIEVTAPGHTPASASWPSLRSGIDVDLGDIALLRGCAVQARVVDERGEPVPGVLLEIERRSGGATDEHSLFTMWSSFETESGADGALPPAIVPAPGTYGIGVSFRRPGWRVVRPAEFVADASPIVADIVVARPPQHDSLVGRVVDERSNPVAGVTLCVEPEMLELGSATSGPDGAFWLPLEVAQPELPLHLPVTERGFVLLEPDRAYRRGDTDVEVRVGRQPGHDVPIEVVAARDGAAVTSYGLRWELDYWVDEMKLSIPPDRIYRPAAAEPRPGGRAVVRALHPGRYRLCVFPAAHDLATAYLVPFSVRADGADPVRVELAGFAPLRAVVRDEAGAPQVDVQVTLVHTMATGGEYSGLFSQEQFARGVGGGRDTAVALQSARTDADGTVVLRAPVGEPRLGLRLAGPFVRPQARNLAAVAAAGRDELLTVPVLARVRGHVGPAELLARIGPPAAARREAAMVRAEDSDLASSCPRIALVDAAGAGGGSAVLLPDGTFTIDAAEPGDHRLVLYLDWAMNPGFYTAETLTLGEVHDLRAGEVREVEIDAARWMPSRLRGTVAVDGAPWTRGVFALLDSEPGSDEMFRIELGPDGSFDRVQRPGRYLPCVVWEEPDGEKVLMASQRLDLRPGGDDLERFSFERRTLRIGVVRADGGAAGGAVLRTVPVDFPEAQRVLPDRCTAGDDGSLVFDPAPPGRVQFFELGERGAMVGECAAGAQAVTEVRLRLPR